jgi:hypothetical protein
MSESHSDALVFFGATGDLAYKKIFPALEAMLKRGRLNVPVIGVAKAGWTIDQLRARARDSLEKHGGVDASAFDRLSGLLRYVDGDYKDPSTFQSIRKQLGCAARPAHYLAIPPVLFGVVVEQLARSGYTKDKRGHIVVDGTMRCLSHPEVWALGDCASLPAPDGNPYPNLAQHALREARVLARNIYGVLNGQPPLPFIYNTLGRWPLGHSRAFGELLKVRVHGGVAWFVRRTYYLLQKPGWSRRLRIISDWTFALLYRLDIVKISLDSETVLLLRDAAAGAFSENKRSERSPGSGAPSLAGVTGGRPSVQTT